MRQVPHYLIIGAGRLARHFQYYFKSLGLSFETWQRNEEQLIAKAMRASHILILISDNEIEHFIRTHLTDVNAVKIHCSGSLVTSMAFGAHPLMTFSNALYELSHYLKIPFILDEDSPLLPGIPNQQIRLNKSLKAKYHALCVLSGNFSCILWQKLFSGLEELKLPKEIAFPYLHQLTQNLLNHPENALTGPLVRNDFATIAKNISALTGDKFQDIYKAFVECYQK